MKKITFILLFALCSGLCFAQPANDEPAGAIALTVGAAFADNAIIADNVLATASEVADPTIPVPGCSSYLGGDVWFILTVPASGALTIETNEDTAGGSTMDDTGMAVYSGPIGAFVLVECDDDDSADGFFSLINLSGRTPGEQLYIRVFEYANDLEDTFQVSAYFVPAPANDDFANAETVVCDGNYVNDTSNATLDEDDAPDGFGADNDAPNIWYTYTGSGVEEEITVDLCASGYDTAFLVYTGVSGALTVVGGNDDNAGQCGAGFRSYGSFTSDGTTQYFICVTGFGPASIGPVDMTISCAVATDPPANDECLAATTLTVAVATNGTTVGATQNGAEAQPSCDTFGTIADVWYSFVATDANMTVTTVLGSADQANVAVYEDDNCALATQVGCSDANGGETLNLTALVVDNTYIVRVWNDGVPATPPSELNRIEGDFDITVDVTLSTNSFENENAFTYYPNPVRNELTLNAQKDIQNVSLYNMLGQEVIRTQPNSVDSTVDMNGLSQGAYFVQVTIDNVTETIRIIKQ